MIQAMPPILTMKKHLQVLIPAILQDMDANSYRPQPQVSGRLVPLDSYPKKAG